MSSPKIALIHEWLVDYSGSERVVEQMLNVYPESDIFALVEFLPEDLRWFIKNKEVNTSFIQSLPFSRKKYRNYLPFMPLAAEQLNVSSYDLILSSNHAVSKGIITNSSQLHICYCHSPIRYAWDLYFQYLQEAKLEKGLKAFLAKLILHYIRMWDFGAAKRVDYFIANSQYIAQRIKKVYRRESTVIYPPVDIDNFSFESSKEDYYLTASRMVPYKKIDLIVRAFSKMPDKKLIVIGDGPDFKKLKQVAGKNIELLGFQPFEDLKKYMEKTKAFVFAADEDFGIVPVEAQACGTPVIAFGKGGVLETVIENETGIFFKEQNEQSLMQAVNSFEKYIDHFDAALIRKNAERFSQARFRKEYIEFVNNKYEEFKNTTQHPNKAPIHY